MTRMWMQVRRQPGTRQERPGPSQPVDGYIATWTIPEPHTETATERAPMARFFVVLPGRPA